VVKKTATLEHNRKKNYLLDENTVHPFLVRLGVQTETGQIKKAHYDKFRQINRFIEYIDDAIEYLPKNRTVRILDFGSEKSSNKIFRNRNLKSHRSHFRFRFRKILFDVCTISLFTCRKRI